MLTKLKNKTEVLNYLYNYIPSGREYKFTGAFGLKRTKYLLRQLGNPQNRVKVIHIAGTSGKGSTAYFISIILKSLGFRIGLSVSPHLLDIRERFQINNKFLEQSKFRKYLNDIVPAVEKTKESKYGIPTYFEILIALAYYTFFVEKVDYAVMETGLGGMFDGSNVVSRQDKIAVITKIGHDHTNILGKTLDKIASQKAGIIHTQNEVITIGQHPNAMKVIKKVSSEKASKLYLINKNNIENMSLIPTPSFSFNFLGTKIENIKLPMLGSFQVQNCSLALATAILISKRDSFLLDIQKIRKTLGEALFLGRMQKLMIDSQTVIIDGAHNPQKMAVFTKNLKLYFPDQKFNFVIALKVGKDYKNILRYVIPLAKKITVTSFFNQTKFQGLSILAEDADTISKVLKSLGFTNYVICKNSRQALGDLRKDKKTVGVITGSLYLLSEIYPQIKSLGGK